MTNWMIFRSMETRLLVGITIFVGLMVLVGWVAINEEARMAAFQERSESRSIERGATLFATNCATCHGADGRGIGSRAPGLNNPQFFQHDFGTGDIYQQIVAIDALIDVRNEHGLPAQRANLEQELATADDARRAEIEARIAEIDALLDPDNPDGLPGQRAVLQEEYDRLAAPMQTAIVRGYDPSKPDRLANVKWEGGLYNFIYTTLVHGRPTSASYWDVAMPAWGQPAGPLRPDQLDDITNYLLNWDRGDNWTVSDLNAVQQFAIEPSAGGGGEAAGEPSIDALGLSVSAVVDQIAGLNGDAARGESLYQNLERPLTGASVLGCNGCHQAGVVGPLTTGTWTRIETERLSDPALSGYTADQYIVESILSPNVYVAPGFTAVMPQNFATRLSVQDVADIVAYLRTQTDG